MKALGTTALVVWYFFIGVALAHPDWPFGTQRPFMDLVEVVWSQPAQEEIPYEDTYVQCSCRCREPGTGRSWVQQGTGWGTLSYAAYWSCTENARRLLEVALENHPDSKWCLSGEDAPSGRGFVCTEIPAVAAPIPTVRKRGPA